MVYEPAVLANSTSAPATAAPSLLRDLARHGPEAWQGRPLAADDLGEHPGHVAAADDEVRGEGCRPLREREGLDADAQHSPSCEQVHAAAWRHVGVGHGPPNVAQ